ncbi:MAG: peptide ABC transporter substrate-binding protein [Roseiflexaceae bacterium]|nr:peptide ABC transporter substrate-binding protein [Roseiflexaceae bacterium]
MHGWVSDTILRYNRFMSYLPNRTLLIASIATTLLTLALLVSCTNMPPLPGVPQPTAVPTAPPPTATPLPRGGNLTVRLDADVPNLRPWQPRSRGEEQITSLLYSGLTRLDARLQPQPDLASAWDASPDGRLITFTLRSGLMWHDGQALTSDDVDYTLTALRAISPTTALLSDFQHVAAVSTPTSTTVVISLTERYAPIFSMLSAPILPKHVLIGKDIASFNFWDAPIGSGPFQYEDRRSGENITLKANQRFYRGAPLLDRVAFAVAPDPQIAATALRDKRLLLAELPWSVGQGISGTAGLQMGSYPENGYYFLAMNSRQGRPLADVRVRQALAATVDLPKLVQIATNGQGIPIASSAAPGSWADFTAVPTATVDLQRAGRLLDEAGWKVLSGSTLRQQNGVTLTLQLFVRGDDPRRVQAAELLALDAAKAGIVIVVDKADFATVIRSKYAPPYDFDLLLGSWSNGAGDPSFADYAYYDPDDFALFHSSQINQGTTDTRAVLNITGFTDTAYDNQAAAARQLYEPADRSKALMLSQQRIAEQKPYLFLWADRFPVVLSDSIATLDGPVNLNTPMIFWNIERWYQKQ